MLAKLKVNFSKQPYFFVGYLLFVISICCVLFFFEKKESSFWINQHGNELLDVFFKSITYLGDGLFALFIILLLFIFSPKIKYGFYGVIAFIITATITQVLKRVFFSESLRPSLEYYREFRAELWRLIDGVELLGNNSFPSGHSTSAFSVFCLLALIVKKKYWGFGFFILAFFAAFSRVYLSQHFLEDILVGSFIGCLGTLLVFIALEAIKWPSWANDSMFKKDIN